VLIQEVPDHSRENGKVSFQYLSRAYTGCSKNHETTLRGYISGTHAHGTIKKAQGDQEFSRHFKITDDTEYTLVPYERRRLGDFGRDNLFLFLAIFSTTIFNPQKLTIFHLFEILQYFIFLGLQL
jgi:hypothetical protein